MITHRIDSISVAARATLARWLACDRAVDPAQINSGEARGGCCADFARDLCNALGTAAESLGVQDVGVDSFLVADEDETEGRPFDRRLLKKYWPGVQPPAGLTWDDIDDVSSLASFCGGTHVWVTADGRHYDSECVDGVSNFFELPFFQRVIPSAMTEIRTERATRLVLT
jgi:hypothetical protein